MSANVNEKPRSCDSSTTAPYVITIVSRKGRRVTWRRFATRSGALVELRLLHARGIERALTEGLAP